MKPKIDCFILYSGVTETANTVSELKKSDLTGKIYVLAPHNIEVRETETIISNSPLSTETIKKIVQNTEADFALMAIQHTGLKTGQFAPERLFQVAVNTGASMIYADYYEVKDGIQSYHPVIDYQKGSLRDDFNFGPVQLYRKDVLESFSEDDFTFAAYYSLRLNASRSGELIRIPEPLFTVVETDLRKSGEKQFDYVNASARDRQIEMEKVCTTHLKKTGAFLKPPFQSVDLNSVSFPVEASVVIPVRNRVKTIRDAVESVLGQQTNFSFNLIVVDNFSTDGTTEILKEYAGKNQLVHVIPERTDLGIGGCWNEAVFHPMCGKFAVQLDSDDLYSSENTLQTIVDKFYEENCAMVIGAYRMTNFNLEEIPPGIIDHKEWSDDNGPNNALRINGLGAPRAFFTPVLRQIRIPNVSYGEDYAVGLAISREYKIGRIYIPVYLCRRWEDNSDASLDVVRQNFHNTYKDRIRTIELMARMNITETKE